MNNYFISSFIKKTDVDTCLNFLKKNGYDFSRQEINIILPYLKKNIDYLLSIKDPTKKIQIDLQYYLSQDSLTKTLALLHQFGF